jgi:hypothetical protein
MDSEKRNAVSAAAVYGCILGPLILCGLRYAIDVLLFPQVLQDGLWALVLLLLVPAGMILGFGYGVTWKLAQMRHYKTASWVACGCGIFLIVLGSFWLGDSQRYSIWEKSNWMLPMVFSCVLFIWGLACFILFVSKSQS